MGNEIRSIVALALLFLLALPWVWRQEAEGRWSLIHCLPVCTDWRDECLSGPGVYAGDACVRFDLDRDGDVDLMDYAIRQLGGVQTNVSQSEAIVTDGPPYYR